MATSPLPRWAPTPSPTQPLWRWAIGSTTTTTTPDCRSLRFPFGAVLAALRRPFSTAAAPEVNVGAAASEAAVELPGGTRVGRSDCIEEENVARGVAPCGVGVFLTWEDVWVTAVDGKGRATKILHGVSGCARPGEVLAIMGPSGCGKTTLLDTLAGRLDSNLQQRGEILVNGRSRKLAFGTSAYVTQENVLMPTLTVREAVYYSAQIQLPDSMSVADKRARADDTIWEMGLGAAMDTRIGGRSSKGISGGQQKRLSICMEILVRPRLLFLDEPTSGLDSAASYHVTSRIARLARREGMAIVAVVHQPCSEVFELFHSLCLLAGGKTIFFGPASDATEFFITHGYPCPPMRNPSDHFLRTINKDFDMESEETLTSKRTTAVEAIEYLANSYKSSSSSKVGEKQMHEGAMPIKRRQASFVTKSLVLTRRSFLNMYRDPGYYWLRFLIYISISICLGTIFFNIGYGYASIQARSSMLMFIGTLLTFMAIGGFPSFVEDMKIFQRERLNGHYGVAIFLISNTVSATPFLLLIATVPGAIAYYLTGLQKGIDHFAYFTLVLCACTMLVEGLMMIVAATVPDFLMGIITGAGIQGVMILTSGFFQLPNNLPKIVWKYPVYFISFHKYALQGFYKNEFLGLDLQSNQEAQQTINGDRILITYFQVETGHSKWVDLAILFGMAITYRLLFLVIIKVLDKVRPMLNGLRIKYPTRCINCVENP